MEYPEWVISIHALVKRATAQLTRIEKRLIISIHALVKRATKTLKRYVPYYDISIHALVKRATTSSNFSFVMLKFQSTPS